MDSFSLLKYWRTTTNTTTATTSTATTNQTEETSSTTSTTTITSDDNGPFFDLDFTLPHDYDDDNDDDDDDDNDEDFNFTLPSSDHPLPLSPSDDLFVKGSFTPLDSSHSHHLSLKSKLLVLALGLRKHHPSNKPNTTLDSNINSNARIFTVNSLHRYLSKIKPFHVKVSKKRRSFSSPKVELVDPVDVHKEHKGLNNLVCKHLGKSRSASSAVVSPVAVARRRDDSLLQHEDGIQSAIAHCKRSFNATRDTIDGSVLVRSSSEGSDDSTCSAECS